MTSDNSKQLDIVATFVYEWMWRTRPHSILQIRSSRFPQAIFQNVRISNCTTLQTPSEIKPNSEFDFIFADVGLGLHPLTYSYEGKRYNFRDNWLKIVEAANFLSENGVGFFIVEPFVFQPTSENSLLELLEFNRLSIDAAFNTPEGVFYPQSSLQPILILISRKKTSEYFIATLESENQAREVVDSYVSQKEGTDLLTGLRISKEQFSGFKKYSIHEQYSRLLQQYKGYSKGTLGNLIIELNNGRMDKSFSDIQNSIFIPKVGNSPVVCTISELKIKQQNYIQVVLNDEVDNEYAASFYKSKLGKYILESVTIDGIIPHISIESLKNAEIFYPIKSEQLNISDTQKKLAQVKLAIDKFEEELALSPKSAKNIDKSLAKTLESLGKLTEIDSIKALIRDGESKYLEFKSTLSFNLVNKTNNDKNLEISVLKTIVAFLNSEGGTLIIGVTDEGTIIGVNEEIIRFYKNPDKYMLKLKDLIKTKIGEQYYEYIDCKKIDLESTLVIVVDCKKSKIPCYLENRDFYVRTNPASDKLEGPKLVEYVKNHFS